MSSSKSKSQANQTSNVSDERFAAGDGSIVAAGGSHLTINTLDADLVETVARLNTELAAGGMEIAGGIANEVLAAFKEKDARQDSLVAGFRTVAQDTQTTLRDTLASALNSPALAGSAAQSGGLSGWTARNPALAALGAGLILALVFLIRRPARK